MDKANSTMIDRLRAIRDRAARGPGVQRTNSAGVSAIAPEDDPEPGAEPANDSAEVNMWAHAEPQRRSMRQMDADPPARMDERSALRLPEDEPAMAKLSVVETAESSHASQRLDATGASPKGERLRESLPVAEARDAMRADPAKASLRDERVRESLRESRVSLRQPPTEPAAGPSSALGARFSPADEIPRPKTAPQQVVAKATQFPVGWLVIVAGPGRGTALPLESGVNSIGRGENQSVRLDFGDTAIAAENHAAIAFDDDELRFWIGLGSKSGLVKLNGKPLLSTEPMAHGDQIRLGATTLRFVALCGADFSWNAVAAGNGPSA